MDLPKELLPIDKLTVTLPSGVTIDLSVCHPTFQKWQGELPDFDFGNKPLINSKNKCVFAELAILSLLNDSGWDGVWVETYGGRHFLQDMPTNWKLSQQHTTIPKDKEDLLNKIWKAGKTTACFDVFAWKDDKVVFIEGKHKGKDKLTKAQTKFIEGAIACGIKKENMIISEWSF